MILERENVTWFSFRQNEIADDRGLLFRSFTLIYSYFFLNTTKIHDTHKTGGFFLITNLLWVFVVSTHPTPFSTDIFFLFCRQIDVYLL